MSTQTAISSRPPGETFYQWQEKFKLHQQIKRSGPRRKLMLRPVSPNVEHPYITITPERVVSMKFPPGRGVYPFSGSAICGRMDRQRKKDLEQEYIAERRGRAEVDAVNAGWDGAGNSICFLIDQQIKNAKRRKVCAGVEGKSNLTQIAIAGCDGQPLVNDLCNVAENGKGIERGAGSVDGAALPVRVRVEKKMSTRTKRKVREKIKVFFETWRRHTTFVTLTFIRAVTDQQATSLLNKFLTQLRKDFDNCQLIWVAERQNKNAHFPGNPHFHLIVNRRLDVIRYNSLWTLQQYNAGLQGWSNKQKRFFTIDEIKAMHTETMRLLELLNVERDPKRQAAIREKINRVKITNWFGPFQIKKVNSDAGLSYYLTKYVTKNGSGDDARGLSCALWHCTRMVSDLATTLPTTHECFAEAGSSINTYVDKKTGQLYEHKVITNRDSPGCADDPVFVVIIPILNRKHFNKYRTELIKINRWIAQGHKITMERMSIDEYHAGRFIYAEGVEYPEGHFSEN